MVKMFSIRNIGPNHRVAKEKVNTGLNSKEGFNHTIEDEQDLDRRTKRNRRTSSQHLRWNSFTILVLVLFVFPLFFFHWDSADILLSLFENYTPGIGSTP